MVIKTIIITAKCSDLCYITYMDEKNQKVGERDGYVPDFFPEEHYGDYVELEIEVSTGKILNWKTPTQKELTKSMDS